MSEAKGKRVLLYDQSADPIRYEDCSNDKPNDVPNLATVGVQTDSAPKPKEYTCKKWYKTIDGIRLILEIVAFGIACYCGRIYYGQMKAGQGQATAEAGQLVAMQRQFTLDERAWVVAVNATGIFSETGGTYNVSAKNIGKTPALNVEILGQLVVNTNGMLNHFSKHETPEFMLSPTEEQFKLVGSYSALYVNLLLHGTPTFVTGTIWYDDIFGSNHWTEFCYRITTNGNYEVGGFHSGCDDAETNKAK